MQQLDQSKVVVEIPDLAPSKKQNVIRVLHVDDDLCLLEVSKQILTMENNFDVDNAASVEEAIKKMEEESYDAVISDYEMPQKNGLDFLKELREQSNQIPFILLTGKGREDVAVKALNLGADSYINKSGSTETVYCELADAINKTVERKKSRELLAKSESKYHALVENSLQGIAILQAAPIRLVFANGAFGNILGYSSEELTSLSPEEIMSLVYHEDRIVFFKRMENRLRGEPAGACFEFRAVRKDGSIIWLSSLANRVYYDGQPAVQGMFLDINESKKAAEILCESEKRYRELANCLPDIVFETDLNGQLEFANERAAEISGYSLNEIETGSNIFQFIAPEDRERATKNIQRLLSEGSYMPSEYKFMRKDGTTFPALITATPRVSKNKVTGFRGIVLDISERKKAEEVVKKSEARYRELANFLPEIVFETDLSGKITFFSQTAFEITGYTPEELEKGVNMLQFVVPEDRERAKENIRKRMAGEKSDTSEITLFRKNGDTYPAIVKTAPIFSENKLNGLRGLVVDITERKKVEKDNKQKNEALEKVAESIGSGLAVIDKDHGVVWANKQLRELGVASNKKCYQTFNKSDTICPDCGVKKVFEQNVSLDVHEFKTVNSKGETVWIELRVTPLRDKNGKVTAALELAVPITERKKAEDKTEKNQKELDLIINSSPIIVFYKDKEGKFLRVNKAFAEALQIPPEKLVGKTVFDLYSAEIAQNMTNDDLEVLKSGYPKLGIIEQYESASGLRSVQTDKVPILDENGIPNGIIGFAQDITERKKAEKALLESQQKFKALFSANPEAAVFLDTDFRVVEANSRFSTLFGYSFDEIKGKIITDIIVPDESKEESRIICQQILSGPVEIVTSRRRKDGSLIPLFMSGGPALVNGKVIGSIRVYKDISDIITVQEELSKTLDKAETLNEKLRVVGSLTRHDVGNKLMIMKSNIYLLKKQIGDNHKLAKYFEGIDSAISQSDEMFEFSRFYEKIGVETPSEIDVAQCFGQAVALLPSLGTIRIVNNCQGLLVTADSLLKQLFYNFLDNSLKYGEKVTQIRLHFTKEEEGVKLFYEDNGVGIPEANKSKLFQEGFTTGKSTGLGLFLIKKMVEVYGWTITEEGEPGIGAKFVITIPKVDEKKN